MAQPTTRRNALGPVAAQAGTVAGHANALAVLLDVLSKRPAVDLTADHRQFLREHLCALAQHGVQLTAQLDQYLYPGELVYIPLSQDMDPGFAGVEAQAA